MTTEAEVYPEPLVDALLAAADELMGKGWTLDDEGVGARPVPEGEFIQVVARHVAPLLETLMDTWRAGRIAALRAELAALENEGEDYIPTERARFCNQAGPMGDGCRDSRIVGGNYGSAVCRNPNHHDPRPEEVSP